MRSLYVPIPEDAARQLVQLAQREFRSPKQQAAILLIEGLRRAGLDVDLASRERAAMAAVERGQS